jgi:hypothetical protein
MAPDLVGLLELFLVLGLVLAYGLWELISLRRAKRQEQAGAVPDDPK